MATGSQALETLRGAIEASEGAATAPLRLLYVPAGAVSVANPRETILDQRAWAKFDDIADVYSGLEDLSVTVNNVPASYQDFGWWLCAFDASGSGTPTTTDTTAYTRAYTPSQTDNTVSATGQRSLHLQWGANDFIATRGWSMPGLVGEELTVTFRKRAGGTDTGVTFTARFRTASGLTAITAFSGSLTDRAQSMALGNHLLSYVDAATIGSTADTGITEAVFHLVRPAAFHDGMDGTAKHTSMHRPSPWEATLSYKRKFSDLTEQSAYEGTLGSRTLRKVRVKAEGAVVGAATAKNTIQLDFIGKIAEDPTEPERLDGIWYQNFVLRGMYDATQLASWKWTTINNVSTAYTAL